MAGSKAYSFDRLEDLFIPMPMGEGFSFHRTYYSADEPWTSDNSSVNYLDSTTLLTGVPCPFGASRILPGLASWEPRSLRWVHSLFSMVDQTALASVWIVRPPTGNNAEFGRCATPPCWAPQFADIGGGEIERLLRTTTGFEFHQSDNKKYVYEAATADGGQFYLTEIVGTNGQPIATVSYDLPFEGCPALSTGGVPYVHEVTLATGQVLSFDYAELDSQCVLSGIRAGATQLVEYAYDNTQPGLLAQAQTQEYMETFQYDGGFRVLRNGTVLVSHPREGDGTVTSSYDRNGTFTFSELATLSTSAMAEAQDPCGSGFPPHYRVATDTAARAGDGGDVSAGLQQTFLFNTGYTVTTHTANLWSRTDTCSAPYACSPGQVRWIYRRASTSGGYGEDGTCNADTNPGVPYGTKDKRDNWVLTPQSRITFDGGAGEAKAFEVRAVWKGVPSFYDGGRSTPIPAPAERTRSRPSITATPTPLARRLSSRRRGPPQSPPTAESP